jgi:cytochrome P450
MVSEEKQKEDFKKPANRRENLAKAAQIQDAAEDRNLFILLAGHETSANTMTFALGLLACRPDFQKSLQADVDATLQGRGPASWAYPQDFTKLMDGHIGALMNETLRLYSALPFVPKTNEHTQTLTVNGIKRVIPPNTLAMINTAATHHHPRHWPQGATQYKDKPCDLSGFQPERWLSKDSNAPRPGSFVPSTEGGRSSMGSPFAKIEFCAALATVCQNYTVELEGGTTVGALKKGEAQLSAGVGFDMGLKLKEPLSLKFVSRSG